MQRHLIGPGAELLIWPAGTIVATPEDLAAVEELLETQERRQFKLYGKPCVMRRKQIMFGQPYKFSGVTVQCADTTPALVETCLAWTKEEFPELESNAVLANLYEPTDYISAHRDNEGKHVVGKPIVGFSFGEERELEIKSYKRKRDDEGYFRQKYPLPSGSVYAMTGARFQRDFTHAVATGKAGTRVSLTCREFV